VLCVRLHDKKERWGRGVEVKMIIADASSLKKITK
jgi:hypothetical protein